MGSLIIVWLYICLVKFYTAGDLIKDCTTQAHLSCSLYKFKDDDCSPDNLLARFPKLYNTTSEFPGVPRNFKSAIDYNFKHNGINYASVNLSFSPMNDVGILYVEGFEIMQYRSDKTLPDCYVFDLSNASWTTSLKDKETVFSQHIGPLRPDTVYLYELYALPKPTPPQYDDYLTLSVNAPAIGLDNAHAWQATIMYQKHDADRLIEASFYRPPEKFNFSEFNIWLKNHDTGKADQTSRISTTKFNFSNVQPGNYSIRVQPFDLYYYTQDPSRCLCASESQCKQCTVTDTDVFEMRYVPTTPASTSAETSTEWLISVTTDSSSSNVGVKVGLAVVGGILGVALAAVAVFFYCYRYREVPNQYMFDEKKGQDNEGCVETVSVLTIDQFRGGKFNNFDAKNKIQFAKRLKLFLLFEDDHEYHRQVVNHFASYLQQHCQCDVMCAEWQLDTAWVHEDLSRADYVVIVNSQKAYNLYMKEFGQKGNRDSPPTRYRFTSSINSIRNKFLQEERYDNIVMVYFEYTDEQFLIPDICPGYKYKLMKDFTEFLLHIHKLHRTDDLSHYDLPFDGNHNLRPIGHQLVDAIIEACKYENKQPRKALAMLRTCSKTSDPDSQLDSGLPEDVGSPGQTPITERAGSQIQSEMQRQLLQYLDSTSQDAVTISPSEIQRPEIAAPKLNSAALSPLQIGGYSIEPNPYTPSPPTAESTGCEFDFVPPDDESNFDAISRSQSEQMKCIVDRYQAVNKGANSNSKGELSANRMGTISERQSGGYNKDADLDLLKMHNTNVMFQGMDGEDSISLGGQSV